MINPCSASQRPFRGGDKLSALSESEKQQVRGLSQLAAGIAAGNSLDFICKNTHRQN